ncbi:NAD(P)-binding protein [Calocera cornea HHB12733]|uniref:NAD(P)-binding protein n=1 Tax=Calocera cornea HHB12733 TaxID=1353952 RepID=A0A165JQA7_9BASI|nr:NAD(P)-binding protein [Calocera cornea HHB12733]
MAPIPSRPTVLVTGASRGIGLAVVQILLHDFHAKVITISRSISPELQALKDQYKGDVVLVQGDVAGRTKPEVSEEALKQVPSPTALILNAGMADLAPVVQTDRAHWLRTFDLNVFSLINTLVPAIPALRANGGRVVFVSSGAATGNTAGWASYNASKAALNSLCRTFANEEPLIASFAVRPGMVDTPMQAAIRTDAAKGLMRPEEHQRFVDAHREGKLVRPEESGYVLAALAVNGSKELSGQFLNWNGPECAPYMRK